MRKKSLFLTLIASALFVGTLTSCNDDAPQKVNVENTNNVQNQNVDPTEGELKRKAFYQFQNEYSYSTYDDFLLNAKITKNEETNEILYEYKSSFVCLDLEGNFKYKEFRYGGDKTYRLDFSDGQWYITSEIIDKKSNVVYTYVKDDNNPYGNSDYQISNIKYSQSSLISSVTTYKYQDDEWVLDTKEEHEFDEDSRIKVCLNYKYINNEWIKSKEMHYDNVIFYISFENDTYYGKSEYTYDEKGKESSYKYSRYINGEWVKIEEYNRVNGSRKEVYKIEFKNGEYYQLRETFYDENGNEFAYNYSKYINGEWVKIEEHVTLSDGRYTTYSVRYSGDTLIKLYENTYDKNGNKYTEICSDYINGSWVCDYKEEYTYDANGRISTEIRSEYTDGQLDYIYKHDYIRDENGYELKDICSYYEDGVWAYKFKYEHTRNENGNVLVYLYSKYENDSWVENNKWEYTYDEKGFNTIAVWSVYKNGVWICMEEDEYTYDENGHRTSEICCSYSYKLENDQWVYDSKKKYTVDEKRVRTLIAYYVFENGQWVEKNN